MSSPSKKDSSKASLSSLSDVNPFAVPASSLSNSLSSSGGTNTPKRKTTKKKSNKGKGPSVNKTGSTLKSSSSSSNSRPHSKGGKMKNGQTVVSQLPPNDGSDSSESKSDGKEEKSMHDDEVGEVVADSTSEPSSSYGSDDDVIDNQDPENNADDNDRTASSDGDRQDAAMLRLAKVNEIRNLYLYDELPPDDDILDWVLSDDITPSDHSTFFFDDEWKAIQSLKAKASKAKKRLRSSSPPVDPSKSQKSFKHDEDEDKDDMDGDDDDDDDINSKKSLIQEANTPLKPEIVGLLPPTWVGPDQPHSKETTVQKERREKAAPIWAKVPLIPDVKDRRKLIRQYAFHVDSKGVASQAGAKMPTSLDPSKDLKKQGISKKQDLSTSLVCEMLTKDWPTMITRNSDVIRVLLTLMNLWEHRSQDENLELITKVVLPLLIDNNLRATDTLNRATIKIAYPQAGKLPDEPSRSSSSAQTPLMQQLLAENTEHQDLEKAMKKAMPSTRGSSNYRGRGRGGNNYNKRGSSRQDKPHNPSTYHRGRARGQGRGGSTRGNFRGGKKSTSSSSSSKEESSI